MSLNDALAEEGYTDICNLFSQTVAIRPMAFTWGFFVGLNWHSYEYRYCFNTLLDAQHALNNWDGETDPENFIVRKGIGADYNPNDPFNKGKPLAEL